MTTSWHVNDAAMASWVNGRADTVTGASVEQHLVRCASCRGRVGHAVADQQPLLIPDLGTVWSSIAEVTQVPRPTWFERLLVSIGLAPSEARLVVMAPSLRLAWMLGTIVVLGFVTAAAAWRDSRGAALFLMAAPLVPLAGVALAYGPEADPAHELTSTTPYSALRLILLRTAAVLSTSLPLVLVAGLFVDGRVSWLWLLPAAGFTAAVLALSTWMDPIWPTAGIAVLWLAAVARAAALHSTDVVLGDASLVLYMLLAAVGLVIFFVRGRRMVIIGGSN
jgi:hypothetical protein